VNAHYAVVLLTAEPDRPVDVDDALGVMKCAPLFPPGRTLLEVEGIAITGGPVLEVQPFGPMRARAAPGP
jgi:hypothetical protein